ncbi:hypothetical protein PRIPAC_85737, partial [Pristionchus pacificus]|uniref:Transmembrane ion channel n=1 Tax=Pristionchus pacificus TaxID=54126 RepID=A0A2A6CCA7_PRIPA
VQETNFRGDVLAVELARVEAAVRRLNCRSLIFDLLETYLSVLDHRCCYYYGYCSGSSSAQLHRMGFIFLSPSTRTTRKSRTMILQKTWSLLASNTITALNLALLVYPGETHRLKIEKEERTHHSDMTKLEQHIKSKGLNPLFPPQLPIKITIATISLENVHLDEHAQTLSAFLLVQSMHQNKRLKWNASEFDGRSELLIPIWEVWTPKFVALNSIKILDDIDFTLPNYAIGKLYTGYKSATVSVFPVQHVTVDCKFGRDFIFAESNVNLHKDDYFENITHFNGWHVKSKTFKFASVNSSLHEVGSNDPTRTLNAMKIMVSLERDTTYYFPIMIYPSMIISAISGLSFFLLNNRLVLLLIFSNLLLLSIFMASVMSKLPTKYITHPAILTFWQVEMFLSIAQLSACLIRMNNNARQKFVINSVFTLANFCNEDRTVQIEMIVGKMREMLEELNSADLVHPIRFPRNSRQQDMAIYLMQCRIRLNEDAIARYRKELTRMLMDGMTADSNYLLINETEMERQGWKTGSFSENGTVSLNNS